MSLQLLLDDEWTIPIPITDDLRETWGIQHARSRSVGNAAALSERLADCFALCLTECLDPDLKPPTSAQVVYATDISRVLGVSLPFEALRYRGAMAKFIESYVESVNTKRRKRSI